MLEGDRETEQMPHLPAAAPVGPEVDRRAGRDRAGCVVLDRNACLKLLAGGGIGHIAITAHALPLVLPVRYAVCADQIVLRVAAGSTLDEKTAGVVVAFATDGVEPCGRAEWSVSLVGRASHVDDPTSVERAVAMSLPSWSVDDHDRAVAISIDHVSGRSTVGLCR